MKPRQVRGGVIQNKSVHRHAPGSPARACEASFVPEESATNREMLIAVPDFRRIVMARPLREFSI